MAGGGFRVSTATFLFWRQHRESTGISLARQLTWVLWLHLPVMVAHSIAVAQWSFTRPISVSATLYMLVALGILSDAAGQPTAIAFALYALVNLAIVWGSVLLILRGPRVLGWMILLLLIAAAGRCLRHEQPVFDCWQRHNSRTAPVPRTPATRSDDVLSVQLGRCAHPHVERSEPSRVGWVA